MTTGTWDAERVKMMSARPRLSRLRPFPFHPLLFAAYPILFLFSENLTEVALAETFQPILRAALVAGAIALIAALVLRLDLRRGALVASALVVVWFAYGHVQGLVAPMGATRDVQLAGWLVFVILVAVAALLLSGRWIARLTSTLNVLSVVLVVMTLTSIVPYQVSRSANAAAPLSDTPRPVHAGDRDIYFLVFDRYGNQESLTNLADADNDLPGWLESKGFVVAPDAIANYGRTTMSMAATLNMTHLDEVAARMGPDTNDPAPVYDLLQDHAVGRFLRARGYRYIHIGNWFAPTRTNAIADENPVLTARTDFGALLDKTTLGPTVDELRGLKEPPTHHMLHRAAALFGFNELDRVSHEAGPKFVLLHMLMPHEPYVFAANGEYSELSEADSKYSPAGFRDQLAFTNDRIRGIVDGLLSGPDETDPIIIIEGDEGPYPDRYARDQNGFDWATATDQELMTKFGVMVAMYLPGEEPAGAPRVYPDMSLINTFPIVLGRYFGADQPLLPDRSYSSAGWRSPYALTDITDRLR